MSKISASFNSIDGAEIAAMRVKRTLKSVKNVSMSDARLNAGGFEGYPEYFNQTAADTRFADYYNYGMQFNSFAPYGTPRHSKYGYFEPYEKTDTRITVELDSTELKSCQSLLLSMGGTKINIISD